MIINEDFFDDNRIEDSDIISSMEPESGASTNRFRFELDMYYFKRNYERTTRNITPETVDKLLKSNISFIRKSTAFSFVDIESISISVLHDITNNDSLYFDDGYEKFMKELPRTVFGIPVKVEGTDDTTAPRMVLHIYINFSATVEFRTPKEINDFFRIMMFRDHDGMKTYYLVYPQFDVPEERAKHITFYRGDIADDSFEQLQGSFKEGAYIQMLFEKYPLEDYTMEDFYHLFMDRKLLKRFKTYIKKHGMESKYPMEKINDLLNN